MIQNIRYSRSASSVYEFALGLFTRREIRDHLAPVVALVSPAICFLVSQFSQQWFDGYTFGFELLILNRILTGTGLVLISRRVDLSHHPSRNSFLLSGEPVRLAGRFFSRFFRRGECPEPRAPAGYGHMKQLQRSLVPGVADLETSPTRAVAFGTGNQPELKPAADRAPGFAVRHDLHLLSIVILGSAACQSGTGA